MKILHLVENLNLGGLEVFVTDLSKVQVLNGHKVYVVCLFEEGDLSADCKKSGVEVIALNKGYRELIVTVRKLKKLIRDIAPHVIHTHNLMANYYAVFSIMFAHYKLINTRHGQGLTNKSLVSFVFYKLSTYFTQNLVAVSDDAYKMFLDKGIFPKNKSSVIHNGVDCNKISKINANRSKFLAELGLKDNKFIIGFISRLSFVKDHKLLINALKRLVVINDRYHLVLIGDGESFSDINKQVSSLNLEHHVTFMGAQNKAYRFLQYFDVFTLISHTEGYPVTLVEASCAGLPLIASNVGGTSEIITHGKNGYLVAPGNIDSIVSKIRDLSESAELHQEISESALQWAQENASIDITYRKYLKLYESE